MTMKMGLFLLALFTLSFAVCEQLDPLNYHYLPGLVEEVYSKLGDINIGAMVFVYEDSMTHPAQKCGDKVILGTFELENTESIAFAVDFVNRSPDILPNITLGFVIRGICMSTGVTLGTSLSFLSRTERICNGSICSTQAARSLESHPHWISHDVIGMVGTGWSTYALPLSSLLAVGHLPIVGPTETSDELSNKRYHPYFFRVVPPDMYQVQAILKFIAANGWSYISVIYEDGSYGLKNYDTLRQNVGRYGICIATSHRLIKPPKYNEIVSDLLVNYRARVVVLFIWPDLYREILQVVVDKNATGHFIWIASDSLNYYPGFKYQGVDYDPAVGTLMFDIHKSVVPAFFEYMYGKRFSTTTNPWLRPVWEYLLNCSCNEGTCDPDVKILQSPKYQPNIDASLRIDAVLTLARAAHNLLSSTCPNVRGREARDCITGELLREYLKNTSFEGFNGHVDFDENQDVKNKYTIDQLVHDYFKNPFLNNANITSKKTILRKQIGMYQISTDTLNFSIEMMSMSHLTTQNSAGNGVIGHRETPQSQCSSQCGVGEYKIEKEVPCCWECRKCRDNERLVNDNTTCDPCPLFMWPDAASDFTTCIDIPLTYPRFVDPIQIAFTILALFGLLMTAFVIVNYIIHRNDKVIKASSKELSIIQLFALLMGYTTVIVFQTKPSHLTCTVIFFLFCMSFAMLYSPLMVKTIRIYRIFKSGDKNQRPSFISSYSQICFATFLIAVQGGICIAVYVMYWPRARRTQPIWSKKLVELSCDLTFPGITSFLGYNIVLVSFCSAFAFMVRKLPDNFNESKFISMCVTTTLLIFLAFIPSYYTAHREFVRVFLLSVALYLNHSVALVFLFLPKIYAAKFLPPMTGSFKMNIT